MNQWQQQTSACQDRNCIEPLLQLLQVQPTNHTMRSVGVQMVSLAASAGQGLPESPCRLLLRKGLTQLQTQSKRCTAPYEYDIYAYTTYTNTKPRQFCPATLQQQATQTPPHHTLYKQQQPGTARLSPLWSAFSVATPQASTT